MVTLVEQLSEMALRQPDEIALSSPTANLSVWVWPVITRLPG